MASQNYAASKGIVATIPPPTQGGKADPRPGAPYALPLREVGWWTGSHRAAVEAKHERSRARWEAESAAAFDARHRAEPDPVLVARELATDEPGLRDFAVSILAPHNAPGRVEPGYEPAPIVERRRARWRPWRDKKGRARRSRETRIVGVEAHRAHASSAAWHRARAEGQRHRMAHTGACGVGVIAVSCQACGVVHEQPAWCGVVRLCPGCNRRRAQRMQARFGAAIKVVLASAERAGSIGRFRPGGAIGQKHMVLTMPHVGLGDVEAIERGVWSWCALDRRERERGEAEAGMRRPVGGAWGWAATEHRGAFGRRERLEAERDVVRRRIRVIQDAARRFTRELQRHLRAPWGETVPPTVGACWHRCFEWTPGEDGLGHPHFHMWLLSPWIPVADEHRIASVAAGGNRRATTPCAAPRRLAGAWGWAETMRRERCELCVPRPAPLQGAAWGWAESFRRAEHLDRYYRQARAPWRRVPAVERRTGLRTWWAEALAKEGCPIDDRTLSISLAEAFVRPVVQVTEIHKPNGITYRSERSKKIEIQDASGRVQNYFEAWCIAFEDAPAHVLAAVYEGLEGRRLSQSSKVALRARDAARLGFQPKDEDDETRTVGLLGIADAMHDAACRDCVDVSQVSGAPPPPFADKVVEVVTWKRVVAARVGPPLPPATAPPAEEAPAYVETYDALVKRLRAEERVATGLDMANLLDVCEAIRIEGPSVLPVYRRAGVRKGGPPRRDVRSLLKARSGRH